MTKIYAVTGSNKGIGYATVKGLSEKVPNAIIYLLARNTSLGETALANLKSESNGKQISEVKFYQLDITKDESCQRFAEYLKSTHGRLDVLINNAGIIADKSAPVDVQAVETMDVNYYGTKRITNALLPIIRPGGRIIVLCSLMGIMDGSGYHAKFNLGAYSETLRQKFNSTTFTEKDVDDFVAGFIRLAKEEVKTGEPKRKQGGYLESAYPVSKAADIAYMKSLARAVKDRNINVYGCCPGWVATDLNSHSGPFTTEEGADTPIYLATDENLPNGKFFSERKVVEWPETKYDVNKVRMP
uniref:Carbonyl reductase n=1 Tax=Acrobeloides nanus TaxID=290746 RepID=A0A914C5G6_9BILA